MNGLGEMFVIVVEAVANKSFTENLLGLWAGYFGCIVF